MHETHSVNKLSIIDSLPIFIGLSYPEKQFIASKCQIVTIQKGQVIYEEGDLPDARVIVPRVEVADGRLDRRGERLQEFRHQQQAGRRRV